MTALQYLYDLIREPLQSLGGAAGLIALGWLCVSRVRVVWGKIKCRAFGWHTPNGTENFSCCGLSVWGSPAKSIGEAIGGTPGNPLEDGPVLDLHITAAMARTRW